jgi:hypothetical protein
VLSSPRPEIISTWNVFGPVWMYIDVFVRKMKEKEYVRMLE